MSDESIPSQYQLPRRVAVPVLVRDGKPANTSSSTPSFHYANCNVNQQNYSAYHHQDHFW